jgi:hypothetical protein
MTHACSPELHCVLKYGVTKSACISLAKRGSLQQLVKDDMSFEEDGKEMFPEEYDNIPKIQAACAKLNIHLKAK